LLPIALNKHANDINDLDDLKEDSSNNEIEGRDVTPLRSFSIKKRIIKARLLLSYMHIKTNIASVIKILQTIRIIPVNNTYRIITILKANRKQTYLQVKKSITLRDLQSICKIDRETTNA
jgi:hypothetical protein